MKVVLGTIEVDDHWRRALACYRGHHNALATRGEVRNHYHMYGSSTDDDVIYEHDQCGECRDVSGSEEPA